MFSIVKLDVEKQQASFLAMMESGVTRALSHAILRDIDALALCEYLDCITARMPGVSKRRQTEAQAALTRYAQTVASTAELAVLMKRSPAAKKLFARSLAESGQAKELKRA